MKKMMTICLLAAAAAMLAACAKKEEPAAETTKAAPVPYETYATVVDENAQGPGGISVVDAYKNYPEDKKPAETEAAVQVRYFYVGKDGIHGDFDVIEGKTECTAEDLIALLEDDGVLTEGSAVISYDSKNGGEAEIELSAMDPVFDYVTPEDLSQAIANTLCENLDLDQVTIKVGDKIYGPLKFKK